MMNILSTFADILGIIGFFLTVATFFVAISVNKKVKLKFERNDFAHNKDLIVNELQGYYNSIMEDELYSENFLNKLGAFLRIIPLKYTFLGFNTQHRIRKCLHILYHYCISESKKDLKEHKNELCGILAEILVLLRKEMI